jgi:hypothetical protein
MKETLTPVPHPTHFLCACSAFQWQVIKRRRSSYYTSILESTFIPWSTTEQSKHVGVSESTFMGGKILQKKKSLPLKRQGQELAFIALFSHRFLLISSKQLFVETRYSDIVSVCICSVNLP